MPITKTEKIFFSLCMSAVMVYGMEVYNKILLHGGLVPADLILPPLELLAMMAAVILAETWIGGPLARKLAAAGGRTACQVSGTSHARKIKSDVVHICAVLKLCYTMYKFAAAKRAAAQR